jgi:hypothetical protein
MAPGCFLTMGAIWPRRAGGGIFSNVKAGMLSPLFVELEHSRHFPHSGPMKSIVKKAAIGLTRLTFFKHNLHA